MKKIPTLFERDFSGGRVTKVLQNVTPGFEWVLAGEGDATVKYDGCCCAIIDGVFYKRYDAKEGRPIPENAIKCQEEADPITGHLPCWVPCDRSNPTDRWFWEAFDNSYVGHLPNIDTNWTFEAVGPHFNGNPHRLGEDTLLIHGDTVVHVWRSFEGIRNYLTNNHVEGLVFWKDGQPQCKIKRSDFGLSWGNRK